MKSVVKQGYQRKTGSGKAARGSRNVGCLLISPTTLHPINNYFHVNAYVIQTFARLGKQLPNSVSVLTKFQSGSQVSNRELCADLMTKYL